MRHSAENTRKGASDASGRNDGLNNRLGGYGAFIGIPHWQMGNRLDSAAMERHMAHGRQIRSKTITNGVRALVRGLSAISHHIAERKRMQENIRELRQLSPKMMQDIGITAGDVSALARGVVTLDELNAQRLARSAKQAPSVPTPPKLASVAPPPIKDGACNDESFEHAA